MVNAAADTAHEVVGISMDAKATIKVGDFSRGGKNSKYNAIERCWGVLENHWNGDVLDTVETVIKFAQTMTWKGKQPVVNLMTTTYHPGVRLSKQTMVEVEAHIQRLTGLERWFVDISFATPPLPDT